MTDDADTAHGAGAALLALQAEDLHLDQLSYRSEHLPAKAEIAELAKRRSTLETDRESVNAERALLIARQDALENEINEADARLRSLDERSRSGTVTSFRDQEALANEIASVARRKHELEDHELEIMEALEPHDAALASVEAEADAAAETRRTLEAQIAFDEAEIATEVGTVIDRRATLAAEVPAALLTEYEKLRAHLGGIGVARVVHGNCSGCNLHLAATELDRIRHLTGDTLEHCDQCGRLLVP
jgi:hypothetical protein